MFVGNDDGDNDDGDNDCSAPGLTVQGHPYVSIHDPRIRSSREQHMKLAYRKHIAYITNTKNSQLVT